MLLQKKVNKNLLSTHETKINEVMKQMNLFSVEASLLGQILISGKKYLSRRHYQPTYQLSEGVYLQISSLRKFLSPASIKRREIGFL